MKKNFLIAYVALGMALAGCSGNKSDSTASTDIDFDAYKGRFVDKMWEMNPSAAIYAGFHNYDSLLLVPDAAARAASDLQYHAMLDSLAKFDESKLSQANKTDLWMMRDYLKSNIWSDTAFKSFEWNPSSFNVAGEFAEILNGNYDKLDARLTMFDKRLANVKAYYAAAKAQITQPTIEHTDLAIMQHEGSVDEVFGKY